MKLVPSVPYSISYCGLPLGSLGGSQWSSKPSERMRVTDSSRGTEGAVHGRKQSSTLHVYNLHTVHLLPQVTAAPYLFQTIDL